jgi:hypothetical protein
MYAWQGAEKKGIAGPEHIGGTGFSLFKPFSESCQALINGQYAACVKHKGDIV